MVSFFFFFFLEARINRIWKGIDYEGGKAEDTVQIDSRDSVFCSQMNAVPFANTAQQEREFGGRGAHELVWEIRLF